MLGCHESGFHCTCIIIKGSRLMRIHGFKGHMHVMEEVEPQNKVDSRQTGVLFFLRVV